MWLWTLVPGKLRRAIAELARAWDHLYRHWVRAWIVEGDLVLLVLPARHKVRCGAAPRPQDLEARRVGPLVGETSVCKHSIHSPRSLLTIDCYRCAHKLET